MSAQLELRADSAGQMKYFLADRTVENGDRLEMQLSRGRWLDGTFEWNGVEARWPGLRVELGGPWADGTPAAADDPLRSPTCVMALHPDARLRWPVEDPLAEPPRRTLPPTLSRLAPGRR